MNVGVKVILLRIICFVRDPEKGDLDQVKTRKSAGAVFRFLVFQPVLEQVRLG